MSPSNLALVSALLLTGLPAQTHVLSALPGRPARSAGSQIAFVPNVGQWPSPELFRAQTGGLHYFLERDGWSFWMLESPAATAGACAPRGRPSPSIEQRAVAVRMRFAANRDAVRLEPGPELAGHRNFLVGDPSRHRAQVPSHGSVLYRGMYEGIDVQVRDGGGHVEYDLLLAPGAELAQVQVDVAGARALRLEASGVLVLETELGQVVQMPPPAWMVAPDGTKRPLACEFVLRGRQSYGFRAPGRDPTLPLVVDPPLLYATYLGGSADEIPSYMRQDPSGRVLIYGETLSTDYPTKAGSLWTAPRGGTNDGFLTCLDPTQPPSTQLIFSTYIGGPGNDSVSDVAILPVGIAFCGGSTSDGLATAGAAQPTRAGGRDAIYGLLRADGGSLLGLSYHGGAADDHANAIGVARTGNCVITGTTHSSDMPTTANAYRRTLSGINDGFVTELLTSALARVYSTYVGGAGTDFVVYACSDAAASTLIGETASSDFPTTAGAFDTSFHGGASRGTDAVLLRWDHWTNPLQPIVYSTYLGGSADDFLWDAQPAGNGQLVLTGTTGSSNFPTTPGSYSTTYNGGLQMDAGDAIVLRLDPRGRGAQDLVFGTFLGGMAPDQGLGGCVDSSGEVTIVGWTRTSTGYPFPTTPDAMRRTFSGNEGYVARLSADGRQLLYCTYVGGDGHDGAWLATRHADGVVTVGGATSSASFQTKNAVQNRHGGGQDGFVMRLDLIPDNTTRYGVSSRGGPRWPTIHAMGDAVANNPTFGLACSRAPASSPGLLLISAGPASLPVLGIQLQVDLGTSLLLPVAADANGEHVWRVQYPASPAAAHAQYVWFESPPLLQLSASDALRF